MNCHSTTCTTLTPNGEGPVVLVGNPNVGKSVLFGALTGRYAAVSNYPGTTVEIAQGTLTLHGAPRQVIDTPGIQSIVPLSEDERVTRDILLAPGPFTVVQVVDAKNLRRGLYIALELAEAGLPFVLSLNMADEAASRGIQVDTTRLAARLGVPVVTTIATRRTGVHELAGTLTAACCASCTPAYAPCVERAVEAITPHLPPSTLAPRSIALMLLAGDDSVLESLKLPVAVRQTLMALRAAAESCADQPLASAVNQRRLALADEISTEVLQRVPRRRTLGETLGAWAVHPVVGWPVLAVALYLVWLFVGVFGAGILVNFIEGRVFGAWINPLVTSLVNTLVPFPLVRDFLVGEYGLVTMALTYAIAIVLPIVGTFFLAFAVLEDSGYLPRLAVMLDRTFRTMGLNGKAVLPMILGLGCDTMAMMTTRILETRKERLQVTLLLALGVPCSAQLGVILGMVAGLGFAATATWIGVVLATILVVGWLAARIIPGQSSDFILELPPMRLPAWRNVLLKTAARMEWYLWEAIPIFVVGTALLFTLDALHLLESIQRLFAPLVVGWLGLPVEASNAFLIGFLRRDYGAAGLFEIARSGGLDTIQVVVSLVVITLFMPCFATLIMIVKEHGARVAAVVAAIVFPLAFLIGGIVNLALRGWTGWGL